ncbi:MAG: polyprenyl synthetase family protein [Alphaproteobacteria bacterium]|nr:polyprenyl synthetase family protein [Alphaproteobacteria bacterium]
MTNLKTKLEETRTLIDGHLDSLLPLPIGKEKRVCEAMRYSILGGGKALRPFLVLIISDILGVKQQNALNVACALEMVHTYSLIHDDLPAMDNDTMRRGKPTNHIQFDEATAILAGDALLTKAFEILSMHQTHSDATIRCKLISYLAKAAGTSGMIGGQMMDLIGEKTPLALDEIERMQALKTGALLKYACTTPAIMAQENGAIFKALETYANAIGLMFQITDDILDIEGDSLVVGKTLGKDAIARKSTFVSVLGLDTAKENIKILAHKAENAIACFGEKSEPLKQTIHFILTRNK